MHHGRRMGFSYAKSHETRKCARGTSLSCSRKMLSDMGSRRHTWSLAVRKAETEGYRARMRGTEKRRRTRGDEQRWDSARLSRTTPESVEQALPFVPQKNAQRHGQSHETRKCRLSTPCFKLLERFHRDVGLSHAYLGFGVSGDSNRGMQREKERDGKPSEKAVGTRRRTERERCLC